jgi:cytochrome P450
MATEIAELPPGPLLLTAPGHPDFPAAASGTAYLLLMHPEDRMRVREDPALTRTAVHEALLLSPQLASLPVRLAARAGSERPA